jgi:hypothetical protein
MNYTIETLISFLVAQMDREPIPSSGSRELAAIETAIYDIHKRRSDQELQVLALRVVGVIIDRVGSNLAAEQVLRDFIQPGGRS